MIYPFFAVILNKLKKPKMYGEVRPPLEVLKL